jgi:hypothetical protein
VPQGAAAGKAGKAGASKGKAAQGKAAKQAPAGKGAKAGKGPKDPKVKPHTSKPLFANYTDVWLYSQQFVLHLAASVCSDTACK